MLRVHFTGEDLGRTRLAGGPAPMWETALSLHWLQRHSAGPPGERWRRSVVPRLPRSTELLATLIPPKGYFPDFLTPYGPATDLAEAMEPVLTTPRAQLRQELARLPANRPGSPWVCELAEGKSAAVHRLRQAVQTYHRVAVAPFWRQIQSQVNHERSRLAGLMADSGTETLLERLAPTVRWRSPVLEVDYPVDRELRLDGRGLVLIPSFFCVKRAITLLRHDRTPVLVYPIGHQPPEDGGTPDPSGALADLLGHSRAAVLEAVGGGCNTSELARRAGVLTSSASQHLTVLRRAGLVTSRRQANSVVHTVTPLGERVRCGPELPPAPGTQQP